MVAGVHSARYIYMESFMVADSLFGHNRPTAAAPSVVL